MAERLKASGPGAPGTSLAAGLDLLHTFQRVRGLGLLRHWQRQTRCAQARAHHLLAAGGACSTLTVHSAALIAGRRRVVQAARRPGSC